MAKLISLIITIILLFESVPLPSVHTLTVDAAERGDAVSTYATGFLYGLAEPGVPSEAMTDSLDIASVSQKVIGGLQHPTGDVDRVASQLEECDYRVVYLQDCFDTWYYCYDEIMEMRKNGSYDWKEFIETRYLPTVEEKVRELSAKKYADDIVYCIYNECDNAVWFGNYVDGVCHYDDIGKANFHEAWKMTYDLVKSINPDAKIGGPGFCDYEKTKIEDFIEYTAENDCVPEIFIWHELAWWSSVDWYSHIDEYRQLEKTYGINELPIIITEYGTMEECGNPASMLRYIVAMEKTNVYGNMAYWRLSNNLNDTAADDNSPNSNWWLYRKYAELEGTTISAEAPAKNKDDEWWGGYKALAVLSDSEEEINVIASGRNEKRAIKFKNLDETNLGNSIDVTVECVYYSGLTGVVSEPIVLRQYTAKQTCGSLNVNIPATDDNAVYFVKLSKHEGEIDIIRNQNIPVRYEFEEGTLTGSAYTYDSAYATTGEQKGMCGGFENDGDGVKITVKADKDALYKLDIIYGKHNDGSGAAGRDYGVVNFTVDGTAQKLMLENTIKSEYTTTKTVYLELSKGKHTLEFSHNEGTFVLDSLIMSKATEDNKIAVLEDSEDGKAYLAVADADGYYTISMGDTVCDITVDGAKAKAQTGTVLYLRRGLNEIELSEGAEISITKSEPKTPTAVIEAEDITVSDGARILTDKYGNAYLGSVNADGGMGTFTVNADESGDYRVTLLYANNSEGGYHAYNVDLIERYVTVSVNGKEIGDIYCRNTYSDYTYKTVTFNVTLNEGVNEIAFYNSGSYEFASLLAEAPLIKTVTVNKIAS